MVKRFLFLGLLILGACGSGTEVVNTTNPTNPTSQKFETVYYDFTIDILDGWTFIEYDEDTEPGAEAFTDISDETVTVATFIRDTRGYFTVFSAELEDSQNLEEYIRARHAEGDISIDTQTIDDGTVVNLGFFSDDEVGPRGGVLIDYYIEVVGDVLWMRVELVVDSEEEAQEILDEFSEMVNSVEFL